MKKILLPAVLLVLSSIVQHLINLYLLAPESASKFSIVIFALDLAIMLWAIKHFLIKPAAIDTTFKKIFMHGVFISLIVAISVTLYTYLTYGISQEYYNQLFSIQIEKQKAEMKDGSEMAEKMMASVNTPIVMSFTVFFGQVFKGAFYSLIAAFAFRRRA